LAWVGAGVAGWAGEAALAVAWVAAGAPKPSKPRGQRTRSRGYAPSPRGSRVSWRPSRCSMRVVVSSDGADLESRLHETFGRCPMFLFVETDTMEFETVANPSVEAPSGAGVRAAELVSGADVQVVITGRVGPKAMNVLREAGVAVYVASGGTVRQAVEGFRAGNLPLDPEGPRGEASGDNAPSRPRPEDLDALRNEVVGLRQKAGRLLERIERLQEEG
jgi:predicted Fe-Mo cluster-binding NifX family protein